MLCTTRSREVLTLMADVGGRDQVECDALDHSVVIRGSVDRFSAATEHQRHENAAHAARPRERLL